MPRAPGQIDRAKSEAILDAAAKILARQGFSAPMAAIAREAGVSKQTIYNHFGAKGDLVRALVARRAGLLTSAFDAPGALENPEDTLAAFARELLLLVVAPGSYALMRLVIQSSSDMPELAHDVYEAGPRATRTRLARYLASEHRAGRLSCPDPVEAADLFAGMAVGHKQMAALIGFPLDLDAASIDKLSRTVAYRFIRAYAP